MTALTVPARPEKDASLRPVPWRRMGWVTWRQHRFALGGVAALLGALAVYLWLTGLRLHHAYAAAAVCNPATSLACHDLIITFNGMDDFLANGFILQVVPALIGAFVGVPVLARELETGTFRYAWTQGFGRWRWTLAKLAPLAVVLAAAAGALSVLFSWYYQPYFAAGNQARSLSEVTPFFPGILGAAGLSTSAGLIILLYRERTERIGPGQIVLLAILIVLYALELAYGVLLDASPRDLNQVSNLGTLAIFFYLFAVARAWQLVGARDTGLLSRVAEMAQRHPGHVAPGDQAGKPAMADERDGGPD